MPSFPTIIPVVAAALIDASGAVLMQKRRFNKAHGGLWEFPGGKVERAESLEAALVRELAEELAIAIDSESLIPFRFASAVGFPHVVLLYICRTWHGEPVALEAEELAWVAPGNLANLPMPPLDVPLAAALYEASKRTN
ncbi:(deoxy)nucleoside triphosphate pyrophosphohydrolase [Novosphingobium sp.]|uniref:(deoxy)nucleoside triphosphate pyrophosphohydrolase n=1 Tax=Novosphingobium sp. TaxID=1874826 RepID=UPI0025D0E788|nr:(deoxy)nucleoside triphosphate pyrophosphohydrolase [Novosphingobium sp.]